MKCGRRVPDFPATAAGRRLSESDLFQGFPSDARRILRTCVRSVLTPALAPGLLLWAARGCGEIGIHAAFRSPCPYGRGGSSPLSRIGAASRVQACASRAAATNAAAPASLRPLAAGYERLATSQPFSSATRTASARLRASSFCIAEERWLRTVPGER